MALEPRTRGLGLVVVACCVVACTSPSEPTTGQCTEVGERVLPPDTARGAVELGDYDWLEDRFVPFGDEAEMDLTYGPQDDDFCMIQPSLCIDADWMSDEIECLRVSWLNELIEYPAGPAPWLDETPTIGVRFRRVETPDGARHCAYSIWNALHNCELGGSRLRVTADVHDAHGDHARGSVELAVGSPL